MSSPRDKVRIEKSQGLKNRSLRDSNRKTEAEEQRFL